jgi:hypothetical protein
MLESIVDLLDGLSLIAVIVLTVFSVVGSIVAALRAVSPGTAISTSSQGKFIDDVSERSIKLLDPKPQMRSAGNVLNQNGPRECPISPRQAEQA